MFAPAAHAAAPFQPGAHGFGHQKVCKSTSAHFARCHAEVVVDVGGEPLVTPGPDGYGPSDLQSAYGLTAQAASSGATQTIAIVDAYDDPNAEADLAVYRSQYGLPPCTTANGCFRKVDQRGGTTLSDGQRRLGPGDLARPRHGLRDLPATARSCWSRPTATASPTSARRSTGRPRSARRRSPTATAAASTRARRATTSHYNHPGIAITVSSGDSGYGAEFPASSRYVTAVGGTNLQPNAGNARGWSETAWSGAGQRLLGLRAQAGLADRHRLRAAHGRRRLRGRRPEHRRRRLRQLRLPGRQRLDGLRRDQRRGADHRGLRRARRPGDRVAVVRVRQPVVVQRRHLGQQRQLWRHLPVHRQGRLRRADRASARRRAARPCRRSRP